MTTGTDAGNAAANSTIAALASVETISDSDKKEDEERKKKKESEDKATDDKKTDDSAKNYCN